MVNAHIVVLSAAVMVLLGLLCSLAAHRPGARGARRRATNPSVTPSDPTLPEASDVFLGPDTLARTDTETSRRTIAGEARPLDEHAIRRSWAQRCRQDGEAFRDIERVLRSGEPVPAFVPVNPPSIEQIAHDLRRLDRQRRVGPTRTSRRWLAEVERAYDERLCMACRCLGLDEHLEPLEGIDRDIERVRVEGQLEAAGLTLRA